MVDHGERFRVPSVRHCDMKMTRQFVFRPIRDASSVVSSRCPRQQTGNPLPLFFLCRTFGDSSLTSQKSKVSFDTRDFHVGYRAWKKLFSSESKGMQQSLCSLERFAGMKTRASCDNRGRFFGEVFK